MFGKGGQQGAFARLAARAIARPDVDYFVLWPENIDAWHLFNAAETQWRYVDGMPTGLDYPGVRASPAFRSLLRDKREPVFADLCVMERAWARERVRLEVERRQSNSLPR